MFAETMAGLDEDPAAHLETAFDAGHDEMVMVRDMPFASTCEHHLVPFIGVAHVAYIPGDEGMITGLSKIARLVDGFARRPQVQERLTTQIADALGGILQPAGVLVVLEAEHLCMSIRGVKKPGRADRHVGGPRQLPRRRPGPRPRRWGSSRAPAAADGVPARRGDPPLPCVRRPRAGRRTDLRGLGHDTRQLRRAAARRPGPPTPTSSPPSPGSSTPCSRRPPRGAP